MAHRSRSLGSPLMPASILVALSVSLVGCSASPTTREPAAQRAARSSPVVTPTPTETEHHGPPLLGYPAERLEPGVYGTEGVAVSTTFKVAGGWWGEQGSSTGWAIWRGPSADPARSKVSLWVDELDLAFQDAVARFRRVEKLDPGTPERMKIDGRRALLFDAETRGHVLLDEAFGIPVDILSSIEATRQALVDLGGTTLLVRVELPKGEKHLPAAVRTLTSFRFD